MPDVISRVSRLLSNVGKDHSPLKPTELFNEGWMLRLVLDYLSTERSPQHPWSFAQGATWFSECLLRSPFLPERRGDPRAEGWTNADGVIGHVQVNRPRGDLSLTKEPTQFVVVEAKMFSGLSPGVKRCPTYDQASRYTACISELIKDSLPRLKQIAFHVVAPKVQIDAGVFGQRVTTAKIRDSVEGRVKMYGGARDTWFNEVFLLALEKIDVKLMSWEDILTGLPPEMTGFYQLCLNQRWSSAATNRREIAALDKDAPIA